MKRNKVIVTYAEILTYAIEKLTDKENEWSERILIASQTEPKIAEVMKDRDPWIDKLNVMKKLYEIETGEEWS